jgi:hypothetical protein
MSNAAQQSPPDAGASADPKRTRRALLTGAAVAVGALVVDAIDHSAPASAATGDRVRVGHSHVGNKATQVSNTNASAGARGLIGKTTFTGDAPGAAGVWGDAKGKSAAGVLGTAEGRGGRGVYGISERGTGVAGVGKTIGVGGVSEHAGVSGKGDVTGVYGTGEHYGVRGVSTSNYGVLGDGGYTGVFGTGPYGTYGTGASAGAVGTTNAGYGVYGLGPVGVVGLANGAGYGVWGYGSDSGAYGVVAQGGYRGVHGSGGNAGVYGESGYVGLWGRATTNSGLNYGIFAGTASQTEGWAGVFNGRVYVAGNLQKAGGGFQIDHPLEPARRYLVHSFVEAPERLNVYSGTATLDGNGRATVSLPRYFGAANRDFRYQLTALGSPAPELHVAQRIQNNRFSIAGGAARQQVSWQVTGVRQDAWAQANPMPVEPLKARRDQGKFLNPEVHGQPYSAGIHALESPFAVPAGRRPGSLRSQPRLAAD